MKKIYLLLIALVAGSLPLLAQQEATLHSMRSLPQNHYLNPAFTPQQQFFLGLPGISSTYFSVSNSGFNYNSLIERDPLTDSLYINLSQMQQGLGDKNYLSAAAQTDLLSLGLKINARMYLFMASTLKTHNQFMYPKGLSGLLIEGNEAYIGEEVAFSPELDHTLYLENAIGASYIVNKKLTVGARLKFLKGITNISTRESDFSLHTHEETYALQLTGNMQVQTAGIAYLTDSTKTTEDYQALRYGDLNNNGFAVDLGVTYELNPRLSLGFSALNLGSINWKSYTREYHLDETNLTFEGLDARELANGGSGMDGFTEEVEQRMETLSSEGQPIESYRSGLPTQFYLSARYELLRNLQANAILMGQLYNGNFRPGFSAALNKDFGRRIGLTLSYSALNRGHNLGAGLSYRLTPVQFYMVSDNLISTPVFYRSAKGFGMRLGMNIMFGYRKSQAKLPYAN